MKEEYAEEMKRIPEPNIEGARLHKIDDVCLTHLYCITPKHLEYSDSMYLDIEGAEKKGAVCGICKDLNRKHGTPILKHSEHKVEKTLFIVVPQNSNLNGIKGLHDYLKSIMPVCKDLGITGCAFPTMEQV